MIAAPALLGHATKPTKADAKNNGPRPDGSNRPRCPVKCSDHSPDRDQCSQRHANNRKDPLANRWCPSSRFGLLLVRSLRTALRRRRSGSKRRQFWFAFVVAPLVITHHRVGNAHHSAALLALDVAARQTIFDSIPLPAVGTLHVYRHLKPIWPANGPVRVTIGLSGYRD